MQDMEVTIIMPCLNEERTVGICVENCKRFIEDMNVEGEIIVIDNGSKDSSGDIASRFGATVILEEKKGYGNALLAGIQAAKGKYIIMMDCDDTYDIFEAKEIITKLRNGSSMIVGNRFMGKIEKKAMPFLHKYVGNPILSFLGKKLFKINIGDFHCGLRGFVLNDIKKLPLKSEGMEFASELVVLAALHCLEIDEVPVTLKCSSQKRRSKLRTVRDGFRHLLFLLGEKEKHPKNNI